MRPVHYHYYVTSAIVFIIMEYNCLCGDYGMVGTKYFGSSNVYTLLQYYIVECYSKHNTHVDIRRDIWIIQNQTLVYISILSGAVTSNVYMPELFYTCVYMRVRMCMHVYMYMYMYMYVYMYVYVHVHVQVYVRVRMHMHMYMYMYMYMHVCIGHRMRYIQSKHIQHYTTILSVAPYDYTALPGMHIWHGK